MSEPTEKQEIVEEEHISPQEKIVEENQDKVKGQVEIQKEPLQEQFIEDNPELSKQLKDEGNAFFKEQTFLEAINKYRQALRYSPQSENKIRAILYSNISICLSKQLSFVEAAKYCQKATKSDPSYLKAQLNLPTYYQKADRLDEALEQNKKLLEMYPNDMRVVIKIKQLQKRIEERNQKQKKEVLDGLKGIGNNILGYFGMSLDNFKMEQGSGGGYNVSYKP